MIVVYDLAVPHACHGGRVLLLEQRGWSGAFPKLADQVAAYALGHAEANAEVVAGDRLLVAVRIGPGGAEPESRRLRVSMEVAQSGQSRATPD